MIEKGIQGIQSLLVTDNQLAQAVGSGTLPVFATPSMIALIEKTCELSVRPLLEEGAATVGTHLDIRHTAATPCARRVTCESTLSEVDGRRLVFTVRVCDESGEIGGGTHERFIFFKEKFLAKANLR